MKKTRRSQPAPKSEFVERNGKRVQRQDSSNSDDFNSSLSQSVPDEHAKTTGKAELSRRKANQSRNSATNLGRGKSSSVVVE